MNKFHCIICVYNTNYNVQHVNPRKFQTTINDINVKMQDNQKSNQTLREDNMELASKLKSLLEEYRTREEVCIVLIYIILYFYLYFNRQHLC